jgi:hypothetical protein
MAAKPLDTIVGQPTTKSMERMMEKMAQMVAPVKTTAWGRLHGSLALVLNDVDYATVTRRAVTLTTCLVQPPSVNPAIEDDTTQCELLRLQADMKNFQKVFNLQEAVTNIGVKCIINSIKEQYVKELNEDYFSYANQTIKSLLKNLHTNWCKVMTKECTDATKLSTTHGYPAPLMSSHSVVKWQNFKRSATRSTSSPPTRPKNFILLARCKKVTTSRKIR